MPLLTMASQATARNEEAESMLAALRPIQNLAKNWDIDIASCLEEFLRDLVDGGMSIDEEDLPAASEASAGNMEWSKAALVLHNSSHVYSRKVEYLHNLVLAAFERMSKQGSSKTRRSKGTKDDEVDEFFDFDPHQSFLLLDDVLPVDKTPDSRHINLPTSAKELEMTRRLSSLNTTMLGQTPSRTNLQSASGTLLGSNTSSSGSAWLGAAIANSNSGGGATSGALRLMNGVCELDETGRLILPGSQTRRSSVETDDRDQNKDQRQSLGDVAHGDHNNNNNDNDDDDDGGMFYGGDDDDYDDGPGMVFADDTENDPPNVLRQAATDSGNKDSNRKVHFAQDKPDPWALLDPHEPTTSSASSKPLRLGKTIKLPERLRKKKSNSASRRKIPGKDERRMFTIEAFNHFSDPDNVEEPYIPFKGPVYGDEFAHIARRQQAKRNAEKRRQREQHMGEEEEEQENDPINYPTYNDADDDDDGYMGGDWGGDDDDDGYPDQNGEDGGTIETNTGLTSVNQMYRGEDDDNDSLAGEQTFEDLCRAHIAKFARGAEKYAASTNLTRRVDQWQERLAPILQEEEQRPVFDIYDYSQNVVDSLERVANDEMAELEQGKVNFARVADDQPRYDVCRLFLASLSLCNSRNLNLHQAQGSRDGDAPLEIELLSPSIERPMETYLAPSAAEDAMAP